MVGDCIQHSADLSPVQFEHQHAQQGVNATA